MNQGEFELSTAAMDQAAQECRLMAQRMRDLEQELRREKTRMVFSWKGNGCNAFEMQFRILLQQLSDITQNLWDKGEEIISAQQAYLQADVDAAKRLAGKGGPGGGS